MAFIMEASNTREGRAVSAAQPSNIPLQTNARNTRNRRIFGGLQAPLANWPDAELFADSNLETYREIAGLLTRGQALQVLGAELRYRLGLNLARKTAETRNAFR